MKNFMQTMLTTSDNTSYDVIKVLLSLCVVTVVLLTSFEVLAGRTHLDLMQFCGGVGGLLTMAAGGIRLKHPTEPQ